jgi:hypothetical protein
MNGKFNWINQKFNTMNKKFEKKFSIVNEDIKTMLAELISLSKRAAVIEER